MIRNECPFLNGSESFKKGNSFRISLYLNGSSYKRDYCPDFLMGIADRYNWPQIVQNLTFAHHILMHLAVKKNWTRVAINSYLLLTVRTLIWHNPKLRISFGNCWGKATHFFRQYDRNMYDSFLKNNFLFFLALLILNWL